MLNGKFYTGLPPKMSERRNSGSAEIKNRMESHFFWPDDTKTETAVETRVRRRTSLLLDANEKPKVEKRLSSTIKEDTNEVDTRQRFHKEFANSSIQFFDNLQESTPVARKAPGLVGGMRKQREVTPKLTSPTENKNIFTKPEPVVDEDYTKAKRKQAYTSKIQFYDYMDEDGASTTGNNARKPKMDMNDKREVEKNTKNSPKLQVKRNVRNMSLERELAAAAKAGNFTRLEKPLNKSTSNIYELAKAEEKAYQKGYVAAPVKDLVPLGYGGRTRQIVPKKILKRTVPTYPRYFSEYVVDDGAQDDHQMDYVAHGLRELRLRPSTPKKHVTYSDEAHDPLHYYEEPPRSQVRPLRQIRTYYDNDDDVYVVDGGHQHHHDYDDHYDGGSGAHHNRRRPLLPNMRNTGNGNQQRQLTLRIRNEPEPQPQMSQYMETGTDEGIKKLNNNSNNNANIHKVGNTNNNNQTLTSRKISREATTRASVALQNENRNNSNSHSHSNSHSNSNHNRNNNTTKVESPTSPPPSDPRKHLRSSLCFSGDALMVDTANSKTPTGQLRRNVRSSATQRVSVGLPD